MSKFARLKILKTSVLNSRFVVSLNLNRLFKITSTCLKFGPRKKFRGTLPNVPGAGIVKAAGFKRLRSLFRYGLTPGIRSGRRTLRDAPPPGVLTTAIKPAGSGFEALIVPGSDRTSPAVHPAAGLVHWITTSGRTMPISSGKPDRALTMAPISQLPRIALPAPPKSYFLPLPNGGS